MIMPRCSAPVPVATMASSPQARVRRILSPPRNVMPVMCRMVGWSVLLLITPGSWIIALVVMVVARPQRKAQRISIPAMFARLAIQPPVGSPRSEWITPKCWGRVPPATSAKSPAHTLPVLMSAMHAIRPAAGPRSRPWITTRCLGLVRAAMLAINPVTILIQRMSAKPVIVRLAGPQCLQWITMRSMELAVLVILCQQATAIPVGMNVMFVIRHRVGAIRTIVLLRS